jgi:hemoglobin-like flavoprotein
MLDMLRKGRSTSTGKLIELTTKFYTFIFADYKSITNFFSQLSQINNKL